MKTFKAGPQASFLFYSDSTSLPDFESIYGFCSRGAVLEVGVEGDVVNEGRFSGSRSRESATGVAVEGIGVNERTGWHGLRVCGTCAAARGFAHPSPLAAGPWQSVPDRI